MTPLRAIKNERGAALLETALTMPLLLLVAVGIFDFGRAYQTYQVLTNAAREGARVQVLPGAQTTAAQTRALEYLTSGQLPHPESATVTPTVETINIGGGATAGATRVTVTYPFEFIALGPIARLVRSGSTAGNAVIITASAVMRNE